MPKNTQLATADNPADIAPEILEKALIGGDLSALNPAERIAYYHAVCTSLKLNRLTRPFIYATIDGKTSLYATKDCTEQLRARDGISVVSLERKTEDGIHSVIARVKNVAGRADEAIGAVGMAEPGWVMEWQNGKKVRAKNPVAGQPLSPDERAKRLMVAETKAKRRATLSLAGLGIPDESELEGMAEQPNVSLIAREEEEADASAKFNENVIEAGGTVTVIEPKKARAARKPKEEPKTPWQDVIPHVWNATTTQLVGKKLSETPRKAVEWIRDKWAPQQTSLNAKDEALLDAVREYFLAYPIEPEPEPPKAEKESPQPQPEAKTLEVEPTSPQASAEPESTTEEPAMDWRSAVLNLPDGKYGVGMTLGDLAKNPPKFKDKEVTPGECFRTLVSKGIPKLEARGTDEDKVLIEAIVAACRELRPFDDMDFDETKLQAEVARRFTAQNVSLITREKVLSEVARLAKLKPDSEDLLRYALAEWENVEALIEEEKP